MLLSQNTQKLCKIIDNVQNNVYTKMKMKFKILFLSYMPLFLPKSKKTAFISIWPYITITLS